MAVAVYNHYKRLNNNVSTTTPPPGKSQANPSDLVNNLMANAPNQQQRNQTQKCPFPSEQLHFFFQDCSSTSVFRSIQSRWTVQALVHRRRPIRVQTKKLNKAVILSIVINTILNLRRVTSSCSAQPARVMNQDRDQIDTRHCDFLTR